MHGAMNIDLIFFFLLVVCDKCFNYCHNVFLGFNFEEGVVCDAFANILIEADNQYVSIKSMVFPS